MIKSELEKRQSAGTISRRRFVFSGLAGTAGMIVGTPASALAGRFPADPRSKIRIDHRIWDRVLSRYMSVGGDGVARVRYRALRNSGRGDLNSYLTMLQDVPVAKLSRSEQFAYWVNLYNARTVAVVLEHYPVASIRDIDLGGGFFSRGPWKKKLVRVGGVSLSLDNIEHDILRPTYRDPRIHYMVNCASIGCPNLPARALTAGNAEKMLNAGARDYINHPRGVRVQNRRITASKLFDWYAKDFGGKGRLRAHWSDYAEPALQKRIKQASKIAGFEYDWSLNDVG